MTNHLPTLDLLLEFHAELKRIGHSESEADESVKRVAHGHFQKRLERQKRLRTELKKRVLTITPLEFETFSGVADGRIQPPSRTKERFKVDARMKSVKQKLGALSVPHAVKIGCKIGIL